MKYRDYSVSDLLIACSRGDHKAFELLYQKTSPNLYAVSLRILKNEASAQECLQEAFIKIWNNAARYTPERAQATTWMSTITRNMAVDILRRSGRASFAGELEFENLSDEKAEEEMFHGSDARLLQRCMEELREQPRQALMHAYYDGMTHGELSEHMDVPLGTIKTWIRRALEQLRQCLA
ncbi:MAG: sigma-70 family RNA polymerase sigma factor [Gammaproteobacteria bacterium]|nr:sigma-70 family RNA polymerase sigma factor [Gammaproteobacteria bacterium]